jgi:small subunit ribosomal protein S8e
MPGISRKTRIHSVVYNGANNEFVRTNTLVKGGIVQIDAAPFRLWYESYYGVTLGGKQKKAALTKKVHLEILLSSHTTPHKQRAN